MRRILVIAGSDSSGGAGLEADQKVVAAHGCYAQTATTALTAQNTQGVFDVHQIPPAFVAKTIDLCIEDIGVDVVKIGMLASRDTVEVVVDRLKYHGPTCPIILDPVMVSTSGHQLLPDDAMSILREQLIPLATVVTPNIPEAKLLVQGKDDPDPQTKDDLIKLAQKVHQLGSKYVLLKGGHFRPLDIGEVSKQKTVVDVLFDGKTVTLIEKDFVQSKNTHGTGCSLASAIACHIALKAETSAAIFKACRYVEAGIKTAIDRGKGHGPINHFHSSYILPFAPGRFLEYILGREDVKKAWVAFTEHEFVRKLGSGTLPLKNFKHYLTQDYLFLVEFARAKALAGAKTRKMAEIVKAAEGITHIEIEMRLHVKYCESFGLRQQSLEGSEASSACIAYTSFVHDIGNTDGSFALEMALAPCMIGYSMIAEKLRSSSETVKGNQNPYWGWIENYASIEDGDYGEAVEGTKEAIESQAVLQSPHRIEELVKIFIKAIKMETGFWDMGEQGP